MALKYRTEIDGLRAIAVLSVILFHAGVAGFSGGFVGVDIFFVISGYLITSTLTREIDAGSFSVLQFYERRVRRLFPAMFVVYSATIVMAWFWLWTGPFIDFSQSLAATNLFVSNLLFWKESGYFAQAAVLTPLLHTWSLSVEEQFYLLFPLLLLTIAKFGGRGARSYIITGLVGVSIFASEIVGTRYPEAAFYLLPFRAWELGMGALLALAPRLCFLPHWGMSLASLFGLALIAAAVCLFQPETRISGFAGLVPVVGTVLVLAFARDNILARALSIAPLRYLGLISYGAYLWHWPLFAFARIAYNVSDARTLLALGAVSLALAAGTYHAVERPLRKGAWPRRRVFVAAAIMTASFVSFGLLGHLTVGLPQRIPADAMAMAQWNADSNPESDCIMREETRAASYCTYNPDLPVSVAIWGDSHAAALASGLSKALQEEGKGLRLYDYSACPPVIGVKRSDRASDCPQQNTDTLASVTADSSIKTVILLARWSEYVEGTTFNNGEGGQELDDAIYPVPVNAADGTDRVQVFGELLIKTVNTLLNHNKRVVLISPVPEVGWDVPLYLARKIQMGTSSDLPLSTSQSVYLARSAGAERLLDAAVSSNVIRVKPGEVFCNTVLPNRCLAEIGNRPLYSDDDHLNSIGSAMLAAFVLSKMHAAGW